MKELIIMQPVVTTDLFCDGFLFGSVFGFCLCFVLLIIYGHYNQEREEENMIIEDEEKDINNTNDKI